MQNLIKPSELKCVNCDKQLTGNHNSTAKFCSVECDHLYSENQEKLKINIRKNLKSLSIADLRIVQEEIRRGAFPNDADFFILHELTNKEVSDRVYALFAEINDLTYGEISEGIHY